MGYRAPFCLEDTLFSSNVFCAPLAGCSDLPFRRMTCRYKPGLVFCEMVKMDALIRHDQHTYHLLDYEGDMHPIGAQLCGSKPEIAGACARIIEDLGFDLIDLNCGCPVDKVTKDGSGSGLLKNLNLIGDILSNIAAAVHIPVTLKVRTGWDDNSIVAPQIVPLAEQAGAKIIFVHGRTREQGYSGPANWEHIRACKKVARTIKVFGNGDAMDAESAKRLFEETGCDGILLARGTFGQPFLVEDVIRSFEGQPPLLRGEEEIRNVFLQHFLHVVSYQCERRALIDLRRISAWYLKGRNLKQLREALLQVETVAEATQLIRAEA